MNAILGFSDLLQDMELTREEKADYIGRVRRNGTQLLAIIDDILDLAKFEAGKIPLTLQAVSIEAVVSDCMAMVRTGATTKNLHLESSTSPRVPTHTYSDPVRLKQILSNLLTNSVKFTEHGHVSLNIAFEPDINDPPNGRLVFDIEDTGIGISTTDALKIFLPFGQADTSHIRRYGGTGLGLVIAKRLANALGGDVTLIRNTPGRGSCFRLTLIHDGTRLKENSVDGGKANATLTEPRNQLAGIRILLAEDTVDSQLMVEAFLRGEGAHLDIVSSGAEAIEKAGTGVYDLILMDIQMPEVDGLEATRHLRAAGYRRPIVALTAHAFRDEIDKSLLAGCNDHVTKPITRAALIEKILQHTRLAN